MSMSDLYDAIISAHAWLIHTLGLQNSDLCNIVAILIASSCSILVLSRNYTHPSLTQTDQSVSATKEVQAADDTTIRPFYGTPHLFTNYAHPSQGSLNILPPNISEPYIPLYRRSAMNRENRDGFEDTR